VLHQAIHPGDSIAEKQSADRRRSGIPAATQHRHPSFVPHTPKDRASRLRAGTRSSSRRVNAERRFRSASSDATRLRPARIMPIEKRLAGLAVSSLDSVGNHRGPPVTPRDPRHSRVTGADSPVIAAVIDRRDASDDFAVAGITFTRATIRRLRDGAARPVRVSSRRWGESVWPASRCASCADCRPAPCPRLRHRFGKVREQHGEPQPQGRL